MKAKAPRGFASPVSVPSDEAQRGEWQHANRTWWENHPMRYDWAAPTRPQPFTKEFYLENDKRHFAAIGECMPWRKIPFDPLIPFDELVRDDVLEIGIGPGTHAQLLAAHAKSYSGIDITDHAVKSVRERMKYFGIATARILRMDAEEMGFDDNSFDFVWSWGVIHHSSDPERILREIRRVLRPGGRAVTMVYHRSFWNYYVRNGLIRGIVKGEFLTTGSVHTIAQKYIDGAMARFYTIAEWRDLASKYLRVRRIDVYGGKRQVVPLPERLRTVVMPLIPDGLTRFLMNKCKLGGLLVSVLDRT